MKHKQIIIFLQKNHVIQMCTVQWAVLFFFFFFEFSQGEELLSHNCLQKQAVLRKNKHSSNKCTVLRNCSLLITFSLYRIYRCTISFVLDTQVQFSKKINNDLFTQTSCLLLRTNKYCFTVCYKVYMKTQVPPTEKARRGTRRKIMI